MVQQKYQQFNPEAYQEKGVEAEALKSEKPLPTGIDDILIEIEEAVSGTLSEEYKQQGGQ